jgi:hypothetical protein
MTKRKQTQTAMTTPLQQHDPNTLRLYATDKNEAHEIAEAAIRPSINAAATMRHFKGQVLPGTIPITDLVEALTRQSESVNKGDLHRCEAMLTSQAQTLEAIFTDLAIRAARNFGEYNHTAEMYMRLALKAQSQCRATIEAIAEMKNPKPIAFVKQANIAHGPQQVNNTENQSFRAGTRVRENEIPQNKLLEAENGAQMDTGTQSEAINAHSRVEAVG